MFKTTIERARRTMLVSTKKMAEISGLSEYAIRRMLKAGVIPAINVGSFDGGRERYLFRPEAVLQALEEKSEKDRAEREAAAAADEKWRKEWS